MVRACDLELVRGEFNKQYVAEGNDRQKADARRKAFQRAITGAQDLRPDCGEGDRWRSTGLVGQAGRR